MFELLTMSYLKLIEIIGKNQNLTNSLKYNGDWKLKSS
jgi:hypothetical protein